MVKKSPIWTLVYENKNKWSVGSGCDELFEIIVRPTQNILRSYKTHHCNNLFKYVGQVDVIDWLSIDHSNTLK